MDPKDKPKPEVAASDALFQKGALPALAPETPAPDPNAAPAPLPEEIQVPPPEPPSPVSTTPPLGDYVRELKQEFDQQQEEGKL